VASRNETKERKCENDQDKTFAICPLFLYSYKVSLEDILEAQQKATSRKLFGLQEEGVEDGWRKEDLY
jgi:hypothetical protein